MKTLLPLLLLFALAPQAEARNDKLKFPIEEILSMGAAEEKLNADVKLYFGDQPYPKPQRKYGTYVSNKKTNAFNKSDIEACTWAGLSALISLQQRAVNEGGNAVVNIHSYYRKDKFSSAEEFECGAGTFVSGVTFRGTVVRIKK